MASSGVVLALEGRAVLAHEVVRVLGPRRQLHVVQRDAVLPRAQVEPVRVAQQLGVVEEVGQQLLDVGRARGRVVVARAERVEEAVRVVEEAALQPHGERGERLEPGLG